MATFTWSQSGGGNWNTAADWTLSGVPASSLPTSADTADLTNTFSGAPYTVDISDRENAALVNIGVANATLAVDPAGVLTTGSLDLASGTLDLAGTITGNTTITDGAGAMLLSQGGTLDGVTWKGTLALTGVTQASLLSITTGLTVLNAAGTGPGVIDITGPGAELDIDNTMTLDGTAGSNLLINIGALGGSANNEFLSVGSNDILTFGTEVTLSQTNAGSDVWLSDVSTSGTFVNNGTLSFTAGAGAAAEINVNNFINNGTIFEQGGIAGGESLDITSLDAFTLGATGVIAISDFGRVGITGTVAAGGVDISGQITATGTSTLDVNTDAVGSGSILLSNHSTADIFNFSGSVVFLDASGVLALEQPSNYTGTITGLSRFTSQLLDVVDLLHTEVTTLDPNFTTTDGGTLSVMNGADIVASLDLVGNYVGDSFGFTSDLNGGTDIFLACFAAGTRILTASGGIAVERLAVGDRVRLRAGGLAAVKWLGHRSVDCRRHPSPRDVWPVRVHRGAFGNGQPHAELWLSPDHAVFTDGVLIPIRYLVNGRTIAREPRDAVTYWHVELDRHDVILAEGLACETYLDTGNRGAFANGGACVQMHPDFALEVWDTRACAPLVRGGTELAAARSWLLARAEALGHGFTRDPDLHLMVGGSELRPATRGSPNRFHVPSGAGCVRLMSRSAVPAELRDDSTDPRRLGVAVSRLVCGGEVVPLADARLGPGWHDVEYGDDKAAAWRWTDGAATLAGCGGHVLDIEVALTERYWRDAEAAGPTHRPRTSQIMTSHRRA